MGRPPCCDKIGVKKGPWTPEEDIMLVSYVQEHGAGNWRAVPTNTGLRRCSKSCRLRWTNYLRPGIKRGTFTGHEEKMIIQLQALLGNKWAAIASYLPERTDNDIKNYWNTHLKKKLRKLESGSGREINGSFSCNSHDSISRGKWERRLQADINTAKQALKDALSIDQEITNLPENTYTNPPSTYASSTENIARLLKQWGRKKTPKSSEDYSKCSSNDQISSSNLSLISSEGKNGVDLSEAFESMFGGNLDDAFQESSNSDVDHHFSRSTSPVSIIHDIKPDPEELAPLSVLENWFLDDQGKDYLTNFSFDENQSLF